MEFFIFVVYRHYFWWFNLSFVLIPKKSYFIEDRIQGDQKEYLFWSQMILSYMNGLVISSGVLFYLGGLFLNFTN